MLRSPAGGVPLERIHGKVSLVSTDTLTERAFQTSELWVCGGGGVPLERIQRLVPLKTDKSRRDVVLLPQLGRLLRERKLASPYSDDDDFVSTTEAGSPMYFRNVSRRGLDKATKDAGIASLRFHDLRHTFASHLILDLGLDVAQVSRQLGHASPSITLNVYTHLFDWARHHEDIRSKMETSTFGHLLEAHS